ncbi:MAG: alpha/beta hydrolase, partial [Nanoarchaeota archaeon]|nr:alpha/beta hydrolase [Nanoarchaeota archaeon]
IVEHSVMERIFDEILLSYNSPVIVITGLHGWTGSLTIYEPWQNKDFILGLLFLFQQEGLSPYDSYAFLIQTYGMQGAELAEDELIDKDLGVGPEHQTDSVYLINRMFGNVLPVDESNHYIDKKPEKNILFGHSMGGAGTCYYGSEYCDDYKKYGGLIIIPFHPALISVCKEGVDDCNPNIWSENWKNQFWINLGNSLREFKPVGGISDDKTKEILEDYLWKLTNKIVFNSHIRALTGEKRRESLRSAVLTRKGNENQRGFTKEDWENLKDCRATLIYTSDGDRMISSKMLENMIPDDVHFIVLEGLTHYTFMVDGIFDVYSDIYTSLSSSALASVQRPKAGVRTSSYIMNLPAEEEA